MSLEDDKSRQQFASFIQTKIRDFCILQYKGYTRIGTWTVWYININTFHYESVVFAIKSF